MKNLALAGALASGALIAAMLNKSQTASAVTEKKDFNLSYDGYFKSDGSYDIDKGFMNTVNSALQPRGIRNNNPLNIKWSMVNSWTGQTGSDGTFSIFDKPENGIRAGAKILDSYAKRGIVKLGDIVKTWAPATENNVEAYLSHVEKVTGKNRNTSISKAAGDYVPLLAVMIMHENGVQPYSTDLIREGVALS